jgi:hypothetical protein
VARGYGVSATVLRRHKQAHAAELVRGKHWVVQKVNTPGGLQSKTYWTKRGVVRLGFFIRSARARRFRDAAEDLILTSLAARQLPSDYPQALRVLADVAEQGERLGQAVHLLAPRTPFGATSEITGEPRVMLVPAYFRSRAPANAGARRLVELQPYLPQCAGWFAVSA